MSFSNQTELGMDYHHCSQSAKKKKFGIFCLGKKGIFHTEICEFRDSRILKIGLFHRVKELFKLNKIGMESRHSSQSLKQKEFFFGIACLGKKFKFSYGNLHFFHRVNELFKSN